MPHRAETADPATLPALPPPASSKRERGDVLVVGGAAKTPGAVALTGMAALRVGAGRLTVAVAESVAAPLAVAFPEAGVLGLPQNRAGSVTGGAASALKGALDVDCVVVGPGLDDADEAHELLQGLVPLMGERTRVLLDAFALGALANDADVCRPLEGRLLLTPNSTETGILLGRDPGDPGDDLLEVAGRYGAVVSGSGFVAEPAGRLRRIDAGNPGLATSGSGDVLAGAIAGLVARGVDEGDAACWATWLHATAGDRLAARIGPVGFLARELADELPRLLAEHA
ncbi:MAG TPA: NAD(P)H-hydrate dehydratase, partial [Amnibacterium sp.]|nr:NAD(P)H-hydrate dehydratase [Amnibacterium sp.]